MKDKDVSDMEERGPPMKQFINAWPKLAVLSENNENEKLKTGDKHYSRVKTLNFR